jgi:hypothetical protein
VRQAVPLGAGAVGCCHPAPVEEGKETASVGSVLVSVVFFVWSAVVMLYAYRLQASRFELKYMIHERIVAPVRGFTLEERSVANYVARIMARVRPPTRVCQAHQEAS